MKQNEKINKHLESIYSHTETRYRQILCLHESYFFGIEGTAKIMEVREKGEAIEILVVDDNYENAAFDGNPYEILNQLRDFHNLMDMLDELIPYYGVMRTNLEKTGTTESQKIIFNEAYEALGIFDPAMHKTIYKQTIGLLGDVSDSLQEFQDQITKFKNNENKETE